MDCKVWSTDGVSEKERFSYWREACRAGLGIRAEEIPCDSCAFEAHAKEWSSEHLVRFRFETTAYAVFRDQQEIKRQSSNEWVWLCHETGEGVWFDQAGRESSTEPGDLIIAASDVPFTARPKSRYSCNFWYLPRTLIAPHFPSNGRPLWAPLTGRSGAADLVRSYLDALARQIESLADAERAAVVDNLCRLVAIACGGAAGEQRDAIRAAKLEQAKRYIDHHLSDARLTPMRVAAALNISVRQLHLLLEPTGASFAQHVLARRLDECRASLADPLGESRPIGDIAFAWGFNSLATFYRAFKQRFGAAPGDLRNRHSSASARAVTARSKSPAYAKK